jgi:hypothetical protein
MAKYIELIDKYIVRQDSDTEPPSYIWDDNTGEIVRCGECKHYNNPQKCIVANVAKYKNVDRFLLFDDNWFCADGKRKAQNETISKFADGEWWKEAQE